MFRPWLWPAGFDDSGLAVEQNVSAPRFGAGQRIAIFQRLDAETRQRFLRIEQVQRVLIPRCQEEPADVDLQQFQVILGSRGILLQILGFVDELVPQQHIRGLLIIGNNDNLHMR